MQDKQTWTCQYCNVQNDAIDIYCVNCGFSIVNSTLADQTVLSAESAGSAPTVLATPEAQQSSGTLAIDHLLAERYRIVRVVGRGGFGAVYKATDERFPSKPLVAIKEMSDDRLSAAEKEKTLHDFRNEADLLVRLSHPNLPRVSDFFEEAGKAYLVMDFVQGSTLEDSQIELGGPLDEPTVLGWALQLCQVLYYLHTRTQPIIFRDMKPANVMVTPAGEIKLIDFGIARVFKLSRTKDTTLLGSQGYAPLEQYGQGQSDIRSDIYGLGATLFDLLTHELPADSPTRHIYPEKFIAPRQINPAISPMVEAIILKAMALAPKDRYQSALDMQRAIASTGLAVLSDSVTLSGLTTPFTQSSPLPRVGTTGPQPRVYYAQNAGNAASELHHVNATGPQTPYSGTGTGTTLSSSQSQAQIQAQEKYDAALKQAQAFYATPMPPAPPQPKQAKVPPMPSQPYYNNAPSMQEQAYYGNVPPMQGQAYYVGGAPMMVSQRSWGTAFVLFVLFGWLGIHRFYAGRWVSGLIQFLTFGGWGIWLLVDLIMLITGDFTDSHGLRLAREPIRGSQKQWVTAFLLFIFLGPLGVHRFYAGRWVSGLFQLLTFGGFGIWTFIDFILLATGNFRDEYGLLLSRP
jgi:Serine/threonine protein kinase